MQSSSDGSLGRASVLFCFFPSLSMQCLFGFVFFTLRNILPTSFLIWKILPVPVEPKCLVGEPACRVLCLLICLEHPQTPAAWRSWEAPELTGAEWPPCGYRSPPIALSEPPFPLCIIGAVVFEIGNSREIKLPFVKTLFLWVGFQDFRVKSVEVEMGKTNSLLML